MSITAAVWRRIRSLALHALWFGSKTRWLQAAQRHDWVFVAGCNRSGKTTISNLFRNHPEVSVIPNANMHTRALPESSREGCPHIWAERLERFRLTETDAIEPAYRLAFDWLHFYPRPRRVIMVESDLPAIQMRWLQEVFSNARLVAVVRNGYAVAEGLRMKEGYAIDRCARQWRLSTAVMLNDEPFIRAFHLVHYEEFVERPEAVTRKLCSFLGLDPSPLLPLLGSGWRLGNNDPTVSLLRDGNRELIGRLTSEELSVIRQNAADVLDRCGYTMPVEARS